MVARSETPRETDQAGFPQSDTPFREIVGVVGDVAQEGLDLPIQTEVFLPFAQQPATR